jgi:hypothetical protein
MLMCSMSVRVPDPNPERDRPTVDHLLGTTVICCNYFRAVCGVSRDKVASVRRLVVGGSNYKPHGNTGSRYVTKRDVKLRCESFWRVFFSTFCSVNPHGGRYWPVNKTYRDIYEVISLILLRLRAYYLLSY